MDAGKLLLLGGAGLGAYWLYEHMAAVPAVAPAPPGSGATPTGVPLPPAPPATGTPLLNATDPVAAPSVINALMANTIDWAGKDQQFTPSSDGAVASPYHWDFYLNYPQGPAPAGYTGAGWPPDLSQVFPAGTDLSAPVNASQFWGAMRPYLAAHGLTGLGAMCSDITTAPGFTGPMDCDPSDGPVNYVPYDSTTQALIGLQAQIAQIGAPAPAANVTTIGGMPITKALTIGAVGLAALWLATARR